VSVLRLFKISIETLSYPKWFKRSSFGHHIIHGDVVNFLISPDIQSDFARHLRSLRRSQKLSRDALAERITVPASTIKRFELTGEISLRQFCLLWETLDDLGRLKALCEIDSMPTSIEEVLAESKDRR